MPTAPTYTAVTEAINQYHQMGITRIGFLSCLLLVVAKWYACYHFLQDLGFSLSSPSLRDEFSRLIPEQPKMYRWHDLDA